MFSWKDPYCLFYAYEREEMSHLYNQQIHKEMYAIDSYLNYKLKHNTNHFILQYQFTRIIFNTKQLINYTFTTTSINLMMLDMQIRPDGLIMRYCINNAIVLVLGFYLLEHNGIGWPLIS